MITTLEEIHFYAKYYLNALNTAVYGARIDRNNACIRMTLSKQVSELCFFLSKYSLQDNKILLFVRFLG